MLFRLLMFVLITGLCGAAQAADPAARSYGSYNAPTEGEMRSIAAFDTSPAASLEQVVRQLSLAINRLSRHKTPADAPRVQRVAHEEMERHVCETNCAIKAWYKPGDGIVLDESLHPETSAFDRSILLHELVHYFQDMNGYYRDANPCDRWLRRELDAYEIQNRYLGMIGLPTRVGYVGNNCHNMAEAGGDGILRRQVFSGATRQFDSED